MPIRPLATLLALVLVPTLAIAAPKKGKQAADDALPPPILIEKVQATWWGHAAWVITTPGGAAFAIDPWFRNPKAPAKAEWPEKLDAILVTHGHFDHVGDAVELSQKTGAPIIASFELATLLAGDKGMGANAGGSFKFKDATVNLVEAVHSSGVTRADGKGFDYGGAPLGFVIRVDGGQTIYHAGDTTVFSSMAVIAELLKPDVALLPIGGHFTMGPTQAAYAAKLLKVKTVIPMHYGTFPLLSGGPAELERQLPKAGSKAKVVVASPGVPISL